MIPLYYRIINTLFWFIVGFKITQFIRWLVKEING